MEQKIIQLNKCIQEGKIQQVLKCLNKINLSTVPRRYLASFAGLFRRCGQPQRALRLLAPFVRETFGAKNPPSFLEKLEYAASLIKVYDYEEAEGLLKSIPLHADPFVSFFHGLLQMHLWNYEKAAKYLKFFLKKNPEHYWSVVARLNLVECLLFFEDLKQAKKVLKTLSAHVTKDSFSFLFPLLLFLKGEWFEKQKEVSLARKYFLDAKKHLTKKNDSFSMIIDKHLFLLRYLEEGFTKEQETELQYLLKKSWNQRAFETFLDLSFYQGKFQKDPDKILFVLFGVGQKAYQNYVFKRAKHLLPDPLVDQKNFMIQTTPFPHSNPSRKTSLSFLPHEGTFCLNRKNIKIAPLGHLIPNLFEVLSYAWFQPIPIAVLFKKLFPNQFYHPVYAPVCVRQLMRRARIVLKKNRIPLTIRYVPSYGYMFHSENPLSFVLKNPFSKKTFTHESMIFQKRFEALWNAFQKKPFLAQDAQNALLFSRRTMYRTLKEGVDHKILIKLPRKRFTFSEKMKEL